MSTVRMRLRAAGSLDARQIDFLVAVLLSAGAVIDVASRGHGVRPVALLSAVAVTGSVAWRRRNPVATTLFAVTAMIVLQQALESSRLTVEPFAIIFDYYQLGRGTLNRRGTALRALLLGYGALAIAIGARYGNVPEIGGIWAMFVALPFAAARGFTARSAVNRELQANTWHAAREQEARASQAVAEERARIARELHDVVAHNVSVMVIQTGAARRVAGSDRDAAREALRAVESCGREALIDLRRMMGGLHQTDGARAVDAVPGLSYLKVLAARTHNAGIPTEMSVEGRRRQLSPGLDLVAYRVVQEALTNVIKHAGPATAKVRVSFRAHALELEISDTGRGPAREQRHDNGSGHGLVGMSERLSLYGGELKTGRRCGGGFEVLARIPLEEAVRREPWN